jgi:cytochrome P450
MGTWCVGAAFAEAELALAVAEVALRWDIELESAEPERATRKNVTMGPARGVRIRIKRARGRAANSE